jgi:gamma-glutamylcyclotransferase (GGCT)/AIG2-like uncharacterized protein YtfP
MDPDRMRERGVYFTSREPGILNDFMLAFNKISAEPGMGYANIVPHSGSAVEGAVYSIDEKDICKLDSYEDYPVQYNRIVLHVILRDQTIVNCIVYIAQHGKVAAGLKPSVNYVSHLLKGSDLLSQAYIKWLSGFPTL